VLKAQGVEAVTVSLINAYANGAHEARIGAIAAEELPGVPVSLSHEVLPEMRNTNAP
jgi:N-methylhydantoinase A